MANTMSTSRPTPYQSNTKVGVNILDASLEKDNPELFRTKASRLVDLFPDELVIQEKTITVIKRDLFVSAVQTIPVRDIGRVVYVNTPIFGGIEVLGKNTAHDLKIKGLAKSAAKKAKDIIEKMLLDSQNTVDMPDWIQNERKHQEFIQQIHNDPDNDIEPNNYQKRA